MNKKHSVSISLDEKTLEQVKRQAAKEHRSFSNMVAIFLKEGVTTHKEGEKIA